MRRFALRLPEHSKANCQLLMQPHMHIRWQSCLQQPSAYTLFIMGPELQTAACVRPAARFDALP
jgi:hypothetical protein